MGKFLFTQVLNDSPICQDGSVGAKIAFSVLLSIKLHQKKGFWFMKKVPEQITKDLTYYTVFFKVNLWIYSLRTASCLSLH